MMWKYFTQAISASIMVCTLTSTSAKESMESLQLLQLLGEKRQAIRAATSTERVALALVMDVQPLVGVSQAALVAALGQPDHCDANSMTTGLSSTTWMYSFVYLPTGWRGGGPQLALTLSSEGFVQQAVWMFSR